MRLDEDTLTQDLLLDMRLVYPRLQVVPFNRRQEGRNGADWEWWIEGRRRWFGFRIQAKKLHAVAGGEVGYDFAYQAAAAARRQIDLLIESSRQRRLPAVYALYNGPRLDLRRLMWPCRVLPPIPELAGVTVIAAPVARRLVDGGTARTVADVWSCTRPWSCLATCDPGFGRCVDPPYWPWMPDSPLGRYLPPRPGEENDPALSAAAFVYQLYRYPARDVDVAIDRPLLARFEKRLAGQHDADRLPWLFPELPDYVRNALATGVASLVEDDPAPPDHLVVTRYRDRPV